MFAVFGLSLLLGVLHIVSSGGEAYVGIGGFQASSDNLIALF